MAAQRITKRAVQEAIAEALADGTLASDPILYIYSPGDGVTRFVMKNGPICLGAAKAMAYVVKQLDHEHMGDFAPKK